MLRSPPEKLLAEINYLQIPTRHWHTQRPFLVQSSQGWQLVRTIRNDDTNIRGLILKNTQFLNSGD